MSTDSILGTFPDLSTRLSNLKYVAAKIEINKRITHEAKERFSISDSNENESN